MLYVYVNVEGNKVYSLPLNIQIPEKLVSFLCVHRQWPNDPGHTVLMFVCLSANSNLLHMYLWSSRVTVCISRMHRPWVRHFQLTKMLTVLWPWPCVPWRGKVFHKVFIVKTSVQLQPIGYFNHGRKVLNKTEFLLDLVDFISHQHSRVHIELKTNN